MTKKILDAAAQGVGGGIAGYVDTKFAGKFGQLGGPGALVAIGALALGVSGVGGAKVSRYACEVGGGAGAFEIGKIVADRTAKSLRASGSNPALGGGAVRGSLPSGSRVVTAAELQNSLRAISGLG